VTTFDESIKVDALEKKRPPPSLLRKREQPSFPVHPVDAYSKE